MENNQSMAQGGGEMNILTFPKPNRYTTVTNMPLDLLANESKDLYSFDRADQTLFQTTDHICPARRGFARILHPTRQ